MWMCSAEKKDSDEDSEIRVYNMKGFFFVVECYWLNWAVTLGFNMGLNVCAVTILAHRYGSSFLELVYRP